MDTIHVSSSLPFSFMAKPAGAVCNLACSYCYYLEKERLYPADPQRWFMDDKVLETFISQYIYTSIQPVVEFIWHGGEPLLRNRTFFEKAMALQQKHGAGRQIRNTLQTNGTLLNEEWCRFFHDHGFLIGISIDGPAHCHDRYRKHRSGKSSFDETLRGVELLHRHRVEFNTLSVVHDYNVNYPLEVYRFLKSIGSVYLQFTPIVERLSPDAGAEELQLLPGSFTGEAPVTASTVDTVAYGNFLIAIFDEWVRHDVGEVFVITFDGMLANTLGVPPPLCIYAETCGNAGVVEFNGDLYSCDHYVFPQYLLGNIRHKTLRTLMESPAQQAFGRNKRDLLPGYCRRCEFLDLCHGECPKNRISLTPDGEPGLNWLCPGLQRFYRHTRPYFDFMANELRHNRPPSNVRGTHY